MDLKVSRSADGQAVVLANGMFGIRTMTMPIDFDSFVKRWQDGVEKHMKIQHMFPDLSDDQREFLLTGATPDDWNHLTPKSERKNT